MNTKLEAIKKELKSKVFWISVAFAIPVSFSYYFKELQFLQAIFGMMIVSIIPIMAATSFSPEFASKFVKFHMRIYGKKGTYTRLPNDLKFSIWKSSLRTVGYLFAIIYTVLDWSGTSELILSNPSKSFAMLGLGIMALIAASIIEVSIYLLKRYGQMFEHRKDGTKINLGNELHRILEFIVSPIALISFTRVVLTKSFNVEFIVIMIFTLIGVSFYSTTISFMLLRRKKMLDKLMAKLERLIEQKK
ncbi:MAG: hypothetical protein KGH85_06665 [Thaumarchaeota archaeon]|nr:hypothetical protein [Nitrososphaerota archaeon]